jgi:hypothetical protein
VHFLSQREYQGQKKPRKHVQGRSLRELSQLMRRRESTKKREQERFSRERNQPGLVQRGMNKIRDFWTEPRMY